ncbi:sensor histidine kinase [Algoriphagus sanaruensis]|uniref:Signal transduction histidine kinase internal region domain-containing protein n=1 Tax=Algoriphagus sanaruensis TaxID=1727163 RepID=A0A142EPF4_9BACT|nr:histidine kinase [Algoriphagus sanaruensis]AMQ57009.1 hypothetical protein AO498_11240 [Algoriphagus sanaruensis]
MPTSSSKIGLTKTQLYWLLQIIGWSSIIFVETINYTFFIVGEFDWSVVGQFVVFAGVGVGVSHFYKTLLIKPAIFDRKLSKIWVRAAFDVILISLMMVLILYLPGVFTDPKVLSDHQFIISFFGQIMNLGRYVIVWIIIYYLYHILKKNSEIIEQKLILENVAKSAELELLKTQLNPHFLFNALNSIKALVLIDQEKSRDAIIKLSELLRFSLNYEKAPFISLNEELNEVIKYLELEQIRFGNRLDVEILVQEETIDQRIPPAMILTLAENSIKHGIAKFPDGGKITIQTKLKGKEVYVEISNPGELSTDFKLGIGLNNLQKRLKSQFGDQAVFVLEKKGNNQVSASITYPAF